MSDIQAILDAVKAPNSVKADAWDAFHASQTPADFKARFDRLPLLAKDKADLWDAKFSQPTVNPNQAILDAQAAKFPTSAEQGGKAGVPVQPEVPFLDKAMNFISDEGPAMAGGAIGGALGAPLGPAGIIGGGALGGAAGELVKQGMRKVTGGAAAKSIPELGRKLTGAMVTGALQEGGGAVAAKFPAATAKVLTDSPIGATRQMQRVLNPTTNQNKFLSAQVAPELVKRGVKAISKASLLQKASAAKAAAGRAVEQGFADLQTGPMKNVRMRTQPILDAIDKAKDEFIAGGVDILPAATAKLDELKTIVQQFGPSVSPDTLRKTRQVWDMIVDQSGGFGGKDLSQTSQVFAQKQAAGAIRNQIAKTFPDIAKLNAEFSFWAKVDDILQAGAKRDMNKSLSMTDLVASSTGATSAAVTGNSILLLTPVIVRVMQSTAWRTTSAATKYKIADLIFKGSFDDAAKVLGQIGGNAVSQIAK